MSPAGRLAWWLSVDPGETVGWAQWYGEDLQEAGQTPLWPFIDDVYNAVFKQEGPFAVQHLVVEDWALYPWELPSLAWDKCRTARGIGALELIARVGIVPLTLQPAKIKERAEAAGAAALFVHPLHENRHANDAIRHGKFYLAARYRPPEERGGA